MNLQRLWCVVVIIAFSMPVFAATPYQIDSLDDFNNMVDGPNWVETTGSYVEQELVGGPNVYEGTGSMKFDFTTYVAGGYNDEVTRTFSPALDWDSNWEDLAITIWVWTNDPNNTRQFTNASRLKEITLYDGSGRRGRFPSVHGRNPFKQTFLVLKNIGWNKVIAPLRNFTWESNTTTPIDPCVVDWDDITKIGLLARTEHAADHNDALYLDDLQLELAPDPCSRPYQLASFDDINDELWEEDHGNTLMVQSDSNFMEGTGSVMCDFNDAGVNDWDIRPIIPLVPALDFTDGNDWAITLWVWTDLVLDAGFWELELYDVCGNVGRARVPRADIVTGYGWNKITVPIDELLWDEIGGLDFATKTASEVCLDAIVVLKLWTMSYPFFGNSIYLDDLRIEPAVEVLSEAEVYNADYTPVPLTIDGNAIDWVGLVDSEQIDFDLATINYEEPSWAEPHSSGWGVAAPWPHTGSGDLHVKYRLAWDPNYLYILVEEQTGDTETTEAANDDTMMEGDLNEAGTYYDALALAFDFTNSRVPGNEMHVSLWLWLGLSSTGATDLIGCLVNQDRSDYDAEAKAALVGSQVATSGARPSRVIEAKVKWSVLNTAIDSWFLPDANLVAAIQPGYIIGCDPRLLDLEDTETSTWTTALGLGWLSGVDYPVGWPQGYYRWPTGRDIYSTDIRLVCSAGDLDFDCDVDFVDYAQFAKEFNETDCNNINDFCDGADIIIDGTVTLKDLARFTKRWLDGF